MEVARCLKIMLLLKDPVGPNWSKVYLILLEAIVVVSVVSAVIFVVDVLLFLNSVVVNKCSSEASEG